MSGPERAIGGEGVVGARPREQRLVEAARRSSRSVVRNDRTGRRVGVRSSGTRGEPGDAALDQLLEHDVGLVEPGLRAGRSPGRRRCRSSRPAPAGRGRRIARPDRPGERGDGRRRRRGRRASAAVVDVVGGGSCVRGGLVVVTAAAGGEDGRGGEAGDEARRARVRGSQGGRIGCIGASRTGWSQLPQGGDALLERRVGVEQAVDPVEQADLALVVVRAATAPRSTGGRWPGCGRRRRCCRRAASPARR